MRFDRHPSPYSTSYSNSLVLAIGIDDYANGHAPLRSSARGAEAIARVLRDRFDFDIVGGDVLRNEHATKNAILKRFYALRTTTTNDRVVVFFSGHGATLPSNQGPNAGFLLPYDGEPGNPESWISMSELAAGANLLKAKHVLFLIDSCYSGLAFTKEGRSSVADALNDFHYRHCRMVLTAGEGDQPVLDSGGPGDLSPFAGHLLEAFEGGAAQDDGLMLASHVMMYVRDRVMRATDRLQTPRWGTVEGGGDIIFSPPTECRPPAVIRGLREVSNGRALPSAETSEITVSVESVRTGRRITKKFGRGATVGSVALWAVTRLHLKERVEIGGNRPLSIGWVLVDTSAEDQWLELSPAERQGMRAYVSTLEGIKVSRDNDDRLADVGVYDGIVFHMYAPEDTAHAGGMWKPGSAAEPQRILPVAAAPRIGEHVWNSRVYGLKARAVSIRRRHERALVQACV